MKESMATNTWNSLEKTKRDLCIGSLPSIRYGRGDSRRREFWEAQLGGGRTGLQARTRAQLWHGEGRRRCPRRLPVHSVGQSASGRHRSDDAHEGVGRFSGGHGRPQNGN